jgi:hypothetical protein
MLVSTVPLDCKEVEDVFDIIIRRETVYAVLCRVCCVHLWGHVGKVAQLRDLTCARRFGGDGSEEAK